MSFENHICEECRYWDDINGCWANQATRGAQDIACPYYDGPGDDSEDWDDYTGQEDGRED